MSESQEAEKDLLDWLLRGVDTLDAVDALAALHHYRDTVRRDMARELASWIHVQGSKLKSSMSAYFQVSRKIDPDLVPSQHGLRSFWNEEEWNA